MWNATLIFSVIYDPNYLRVTPLDSEMWLVSCWILWKKFQDGGPTNREILSFRQYDRYRKYKNIFGLVWPQAFRKGRFFKNRSINNENTRPPSWKFKKIATQSFIIRFYRLIPRWIQKNKAHPRKFVKMRHLANEIWMLNIFDSYDAILKWLILLNSVKLGPICVFVKLRHLAHKI